MLLKHNKENISHYNTNKSITLTMNAWAHKLD